MLTFLIGPQILRALETAFRETMRLGVILVCAFVGVALLVGLVGYLYSRTSDDVLNRVEALREISIAQVVGADGMAMALQSSQVAAQQLIAERYRARLEREPDHDSEWDAARGIDLDAIRDSLDEFERQLQTSIEVTSRSIGISRRDTITETGEGEPGPAIRLGRIERQFAIHRQKMDRFVHLVRYHPSDQVREFVEDELRPHYSDEMLPLIRAFQKTAEDDLAAQAAHVEMILSSGNRRNGQITVLGLAGAVLLGGLIARSISRPLSALTTAAVNVGKGRLEAPLLKASGEVGLLAQAFDRMISDLRVTTVSRTYLDNILQSMKDMLIVTDSHGRIEKTNRVLLEQLGYSVGDLNGQTLDALVDDSSAKSLIEALDDPSRGAKEVEFLTSRGERVSVAVSASSLEGEAGTTGGVVYVAQNIALRKQAEAELRKSLSEKDVLLKEVHHRVKNNLQIISSLLNLQGATIEDEQASKRFRESQNRIRSMALIHEQLYTSSDLTRIDFAEYLEQLVRFIVRSYGADGDGVSSRLDVVTQPLALDTAIPCGLIVNELVANSLEHAFPEHKGVISIEFRSEDDLQTLTVRDNGIGLPNDFNVEETQSLGLKLVAALARQLGGQLRCTGEAGAAFSISFARDNRPVTEAVAV